MEKKKKKSRHKKNFEASIFTIEAQFDFSY